LTAKYNHLRSRLTPFGLADSIVIDFLPGERPSSNVSPDIPALVDFTSFDLLVDLRYDLPARLLDMFNKKVLINIDPSYYEGAVKSGVYPEPKHDLLFTIGHSAADVGAQTGWQRILPCVFLDEWPFAYVSEEHSPWTTIAHWWSDDDWEDSKRKGFEPFMMLPKKSRARFELALNLEHKGEQEIIESCGFKVFEAGEVVSSPVDYRLFIQRSLGEFSCARPGYVKRQTGWISDRTVCYLASGKPCVVQDTGFDKIFSPGTGLRPFSDLNGAVSAIEAVMENYEREAIAARSLAEEHFDAHKICASLLSRAF
jgi:hypothetical protein